MAFIDKLKGIFVVVDENDKNSSSTTSTPPSTKSSAVETGPTSSTTTMVQGQNLQKFIELLGGVLEKNNFPGYDYLEFKKALQSVSKLGNMDEAMMFKTVFAAAQSMNVDSNQLITTAKKYLDILENEKSNFYQAAGSYLSQTIKTRNDEIQALNQSLVANKSKLEQLQKEIVEQEFRVQKLSAELEETKGKVEGNKADFGQTYNNFAEEIRIDIRKMQQYL